MITLHYLMCLDLLLWYTIGYPLKCETNLTMTLSGSRGMLRYYYYYSLCVHQIHTRLQAHWI